MGKSGRVKKPLSDEQLAELISDHESGVYVICVTGAVYEVDFSEGRCERSLPALRAFANYAVHELGGVGMVVVSDGLVYRHFNVENGCRVGLVDYAFDAGKWKGGWGWRYDENGEVTF